MNKEAITIQALKNGPMRSSELVDLGVSRATLMRLADKGVIEKIGRGLYSLAGGDFDETQSLIEVCKQSSSGVICLLSALQYYEMTTELPHEVWLAVEGKSRKPAIDYPPIRVCRFTGDAYHEGIEMIMTPSGKMRIYSPAKTVADCFKYRNKIGKDVAISALKDCREKKLASINEINHYAKICKVHSVMRPYMEAIANG